MSWLKRSGSVSHKTALSMDKFNLKVFIANLKLKEKYVSILSAFYLLWLLAFISALEVDRCRVFNGQCQYRVGWPIYTIKAIYMMLHNRAVNKMFVFFYCRIHYSLNTEILICILQIIKTNKSLWKYENKIWMKIYHANLFERLFSIFTSSWWSLAAPHNVSDFRF